MAFYIDPPSGWKWGFPKKIPKQVIDDQKVLDWLVENDYPKEEAEEWIKESGYVPYRMWEIPLIGATFIIEDGKTEMVVVKRHDSFDGVWMAYPVKKLPPPYKESLFQGFTEDFIQNHLKK